MNIYMYMYVVSVFVLFVSGTVARVARYLAACNVCLVILVAYSGFRRFTHTAAEMLIQ
jgi:hypothetical protein